MEANSTHISLETAKLLKDCEVACGQVYSPYPSGWIIESTENAGTTISQQLPACTWQEILWEYAEDFFGVFRINNGTFYLYNSEEVKSKTNIILNLLQQKKYDEADKYFRDNCILIK